MRILTLLPAVGCILLASGCGNLNAINKGFDPSSGESIAIDAKQRVVYSFATVDAEGKTRSHVLCAEPSPDALTALSTATGVSAETVKAAFSASLSASESAASIGLRTQTIQLLRDAMYRLCEGLASGGLDKYSFEKLQRTYQNNMLGLLAIEQLTGTVVARQVALTGQSSSSVGQGLLALRKLLDETQGKAAVAKQAVDDDQKAKDAADQAVQAAQAKYDAALKAANGDKTDAAVVKIETEQLTPAKSTQAEADATLAKSKAQLDDLNASVASQEKALTDTGKVATSAFTQAVFEPVPVTPMASPKTASIISKTVYDIVHELMNKDYTEEVCVDALLDSDGPQYSNTRLDMVLAGCQLKAINKKEAAEKELEGAKSPGEKARIQGTIQQYEMAIKRIDSIKVPDAVK